MGARENVLFTCSLGHLDGRSEPDPPQLVNMTLTASSYDTEDGHDLLNKTPESTGFGFHHFRERRQCLWHKSGAGAPQALESQNRSHLWASFRSNT